MLKYLCASLLLALSLASDVSFVAIPESEVPEECDNVRRFLDELRQISKCDDDSIPGDICEGGDDETGTDNSLNNCGKFDLYYAVGCTATPLTGDKLAECNDMSRRELGWLPRCNEAEPGEWCEGSGECGTTNRLNNCGRFDVYTRDGGDDDEEEEENDEGGGGGGGGNGFQFPSFSQQCFDDAGPAWGDEEEVYGIGQRFHSSSKAQAVLKGGQCAEPLKAACAARGGGDGAVSSKIATAAYLEGPLQCGGKGWFCRILPDPEHAGGDQSDWNFNHCNRTDYGDTDGHCHGSDDDGTFYWWVRDHWHRNYAGRLHCCCDWGATSEVVARCDYRAPLLPGENKQCRDANEEHEGPGSGATKSYEAGCSQLGANPMPEPDNAQCWDVLKFAPGGAD